MSEEPVRVHPSEPAEGSESPSDTPDERRHSDQPAEGEDG
ncbi:hypothetical protein Cch01nite_17180 [Cellulomonas chitinilytica]|uniref:Uncharacterized protein n=1 Tax=Cellulomonas chitinilytica TaxID=398759 RepID=A0A919U2C6_9CELL|nr:hypothetical protein Cch01nite_17180 [Cellulomonas chitinilytica]